jgi:maltose O-acetyltransferase
MTEKEKMLTGQLYDPSDKELTREREIARKLCRQFNNSTETEKKLRVKILKELFQTENSSIWIEPSFKCDFGYNIKFGQKVFLNFDCVILDTAEVYLGDNVMLGPGVHIYTPQHPIDPQERATWMETSATVTIENNVWIGGKATICPGVTIGQNSVIGAGSVVTKDIPANVVAVGNPCKIIRKIETNNKNIKKS